MTCANCTDDADDAEFDQSIPDGDYAGITPGPGWVAIQWHANDPYLIVDRHGRLTVRCTLPAAAYGNTPLLPAGGAL